MYILYITNSKDKIVRSLSEACGYATLIIHKNFNEYIHGEKSKFPKDKRRNYL